MFGKVHDPLATLTPLPGPFVVLWSGDNGRVCEGAVCEAPDGLVFIPIITQNSQFHDLFIQIRAT